MRTAPIVVLLISLASPLQSQSKNASSKEQSRFGGEEAADIPAIKGRVPVPPAVLEILKQDDAVKGCLRNNEPTSDKPFSSWFVAAAVHLDGSSERDLVVLPNPGWQPGYGCWYSASGIQWFGSSEKPTSNTNWFCRLKVMASRYCEFGIWVSGT